MLDELENLVGVRLRKSRRLVDGKSKKSLEPEAVLDFGKWNRRTAVAAFWEGAVQADWKDSTLIPDDVVNVVEHIAAGNARGIVFLNNPDFETRAARHERKRANALAG